MDTAPIPILPASATRTAGRPEKEWPRVSPHAGPRTKETGRREDSTSDPLTPRSNGATMRLRTKHPRQGRRPHMDEHPNPETVRPPTMAQRARYLAGVFAEIRHDRRKERGEWLDTKSVRCDEIAERERDARRCAQAYRLHDRLTRYAPRGDRRTTPRRLAVRRHRRATTRRQAASSSDPASPDPPPRKLVLAVCCAALAAGFVVGATLAVVLP